MKVPLSVFSALPQLGNEVHLYTSMITSKTDISLVGFTDEQQRICFNLLVSVSGCGIKNSLSILSDLTPGQVYRAIAENNNAAISKAPSASDRFSATFAVTPLAEKYATSFLLIENTSLTVWYIITALMVRCCSENIVRAYLQRDTPPRGYDIKSFQNPIA